MEYNKRLFNKVVKNLATIYGWDVFDKSGKLNMTEPQKLFAEDIIKSTISIVKCLRS